jgi:hypothetical protein
VKPFWQVITKFDARGAKLADGHYSRRTVGSSQFMPPGETLVLLGPQAVFGWWRPHPRSGIEAMNHLDGWTCTIFRYARRGKKPDGSPLLASELILEAEAWLCKERGSCGPDGLLTYVWDKKVRSANPGFCFKKAGWVVHPIKPRSADNQKTLLCKPWQIALADAKRLGLRKFS